MKICKKYKGGSMAKYLAADIGASSGRIFEAVLNDRKIELREIFRFDDYLRYEEKTYFWDIEKIYGSIISGLKKYFNENAEDGLSIGIDTWGVDFVILDGKDRMLGKAVSYRDSRTNGMMEKVFGIMAKEKIYEKTKTNLALIPITPHATIIGIKLSIEKVSFGTCKSIMDGSEI